MNVRIIMLSFLPLPGPFSSPVGTLGVLSRTGCITGECFILYKFDRKIRIKLLSRTKQSILYLFAVIIYNIYFHPLAKFPGPKSYAATRIPYFQALLGGQIGQAIKDLHQKYGEVVRIAPQRTILHRRRSLESNLRHSTRP